jgi:hypothetical protein
MSRLPLQIKVYSNTVFYLIIEEIQKYCGTDYNRYGAAGSAGISKVTMEVPVAVVLPS